MKNIKILIVILYIYIRTVRSLNILVFVPGPWKSHVVSFQPLFLELANRGHNVTVITKFLVENAPPNYLQLIPSYEFDMKARSDLLMNERGLLYFFYEAPMLRNTIIVETSELFLSDPVVQKFMNEDQSEFDLVIVESFFQEFTIAMGHKYGAPVISIVPMSSWVTVSLWAANPWDFSYIKDFEVTGGKSMHFWERFTNTYVGLYGLLVEPIIYYPKLENLMNTYIKYPGYENRPSIIEMMKNVSFRLVDSDVMILSPRPYMPSFIEVPGIHIKSIKKMNEKLLDFMNKAVTGVVYFNLGTILNVKSIPKQSMKVLLNVLGQLKHKIVFRWINNDTTGFPENFYVDSWLPQRDILNHPNCKLFLSHGGIHGLMETIDAGIPIIGFPVFGDQFQNIKTSQEKGIGIMSNIFALNENTFKNDINRILTDKKFYENVKAMSAIFRDRPMPTIDEAVYWVEYVARHKGAYHLRPSAVDLTWYQYYSLDVIALILCTVLPFLYIFHFISKRVVVLIFNLLCKQILDYN